MAFITTASGLLLAVPSMVIYNILFKRVDGFIRELQVSANELVNTISMRAAVAES